MDKNLQNLDKLSRIMARVQSSSPRSYWGKGVKRYAIRLLYDAIGWVKYDFENNEVPADITKESYFLNGAADWSQYSYGGNALIYDAEIADWLCTPSELKKYTLPDGSVKRPNKSATWLDIQARALAQAWHMIRAYMAE